ncbi:MAG TPA: ABC transporter permease [Kofleriaceae bacterium]|jgi:oligopeptide transport system permease protein
MSEVATTAPAVKRRSNSLWADAWRRLRKNRMAIACGAIFLFMCAFSFAGPLLASWIGGIDGLSQDARLGATSPSWSHWFGTDQLGRDMLVRTMQGGQIAIVVAVVATLMSVVIGVTYGSVAGYAGGRTDEAMMRFVDVMYAFPTLVFVIVIAAVLDSKSIVLLFALIGGISWLTMARIVRGQVLSLAHREFVEAARCLGASTSRILFRHIVPNTLGPVVVYATATMPGVMLTEAFLSFLGVGVQAPRASWGTLVSEGAGVIAVYPWMLVGPGIIMSVTIFALNFLGDGLRDAFDPQMRKD